MADPASHTPSAPTTPDDPLAEPHAPSARGLRLALLGGVAILAVMAGSAGVYSFAQVAKRGDEALRSAPAAPGPETRRSAPTIAPEASRPGDQSAGTRPGTGSGVQPMPFAGAEPTQDPAPQTEQARSGPPAATIAEPAPEPIVLEIQRLMERGAQAAAASNAALDPAMLADIAAEKRERAALASRVVELSLLVRQLAERQAQDREELSAMKIERRAAELKAEQRIAFLEAVGSADRTIAASRPAAPPVAAPAAGAPWQVPGARPPRAVTARGGPTASGRYQVTGASPDLAYIVNLNPQPGERPGFEASIGTDIPGFGPVTKIEQVGFSWEVHTPRGIITK